MKVINEVKLDVSKITANRHVRSNLRQEIEKYWVGKPKSNVGLQYLEYKNGLIKANKYMFERRDLMCFQLYDVFNVFINPDKTFTWNMFGGDTHNVRSQLSEQEERAVVNHIKAELAKPEVVAYFEHENRFFEHKPWMHVDGMTPEQAVAKFKELGW